MRKGRETLLTLLEAFVYDPLVDWTISNEGGYVSALSKDVATATQKAQRKRRLELDISLGMFAIRVAEMKTDWLANR
jgi:PI-3-kinase-related kinase SMG-1